MAGKDEQEEPGSAGPSTSMALMGSGVSAVELPSRFTVMRGPGSYALSWRWREQVSKRTFFAPFATVFLFFSQIGNILRHGVWGAAAALGILGLLGATLVHRLLAWNKNTTTLKMEHGQLTVHSAPVWFPSFAVEIDDVTELYAIPSKARPPLYAVVAVNKRGKHKMLVGHMFSEEQARLVVEELKAAARESARPIGGRP